jgi:hypothetical protein
MLTRPSGFRRRRALSFALRARRSVYNIIIGNNTLVFLLLTLCRQHTTYGLETSPSENFRGHSVHHGFRMQQFCVTFVRVPRIPMHSTAATVYRVTRIIVGITKPMNIVQLSAVIYFLMKFLVSVCKADRRIEPLFITIVTSMLFVAAVRFVVELVVRRFDEYEFCKLDSIEQLDALSDWYRADDPISEALNIDVETWRDFNHRNLIKCVMRRIVYCCRCCVFDSPNPPFEVHRKRVFVCRQKTRDSRRRNGCRARYA